MQVAAIAVTDSVTVQMWPRTAQQATKAQFLKTDFGAPQFYEQATTGHTLQTNAAIPQAVSFLNIACFTQVLSSGTEKP